MGKMIRDEIVDVLNAHGPLASHAIYERLTLCDSKKLLSFDLNRLKKDGVIERTAESGKWQWRLIKPADEAKDNVGDDNPVPAELEQAEKPAHPTDEYKKAFEVDVDIERGTVQVDRSAVEEFNRRWNKAALEVAAAKALEPPAFRCALASDGALFLFADDHKLELSPENTRRLLNYLDRTLIHKPWYQRLADRFLGSVNS